MTIKSPNISASSICAYDDDDTTMYSNECSTNNSGEIVCNLAPKADLVSTTVRKIEVCCYNVSNLINNNEMRTSVLADSSYHDSSKFYVTHLPIEGASWTGPLGVNISTFVPLIKKYQFSHVN